MRDIFLGRESVDELPDAKKEERKKKKEEERKKKDPPQILHRPTDEECHVRGQKYPTRHLSPHSDN